MASYDPTRRSRAHPAIGPTTPRSRRGTRGPQARDQPHAPGDWIARARMISRSWTARAPARSPPSSTATLRPCTSASSGSTPRGWTGLVTAPVPAASLGSPSTSAASSSPWSSSYRRGGCAARPTGACTPTSPIRRPTGPWTPSPRPPRRSASRCSAARSAASCWPRESAGAGRAPGPSPATRSSPQKDRDRRALHPPAGPCEVTDGRAVVAGRAIRVPRRTDKSGTERTITVNSATLMSGPPLTPRAPS